MKKHVLKNNFAAWGGTIVLLCGASFFLDLGSAILLNLTLLPIALFPFAYHEYIQLGPSGLCKYSNYNSKNPVITISVSSISQVELRRLKNNFYHLIIHRTNSSINRFSYKGKTMNLLKDELLLANEGIVVIEL